MASVNTESVHTESVHTDLETLKSNASVKTGLTSRKRYLITGGGTGGHVYPAIAIADEIRRRDPTARFLYVGVRGKSEELIVPRRGYPLKFVHAEGWTGARHPLHLIRFAIRLTLGVLKSLWILLMFRPHLIIGTGGYVSAPIMFAALILRRLHLLSARTFIHEQNTFPGKLNRLVGAVVDRVGVSFPESIQYFPKTGTFVGYPVRRELGDVTRDAALEALKIPPGKKVVFAFGGSQGARTINKAMVEALPHLQHRNDLFIIHGTGNYKGAGYDALGDTEKRLRDAGLSDDPAFYLHQGYFHNIEQLYAVADLVVCRGGAGTLTEITARCIPSIVIPKANLPGDHQVKNARSVVNAGAGSILYERAELTAGGIEERVPGLLLAQTILTLMDDAPTLSAMREAARAYYRAGALDRIGDLVHQLLQPDLPALPERSDLASGCSEVDLEALTGAGLVNYLERRHRTNPAPLLPQDVEYLKYRTDDYLASSSWEIRNRGVKLVGLLGYDERLDFLLFMLNEKKRVAWYLRLLGGDFEQVGFVRRNIFEAFRRLNQATPEVVHAILDGLEDPYFEVRSQAATTAAWFRDALTSQLDRVYPRLLPLLDEMGFEVPVATILALGALAQDSLVLHHFERFQFHKNWKIRLAVVQALHTLLDRRIVTADQVTNYLQTMLITSNGFKPQFPLKVALQQLAPKLAETKEKGTISEETRS